MKTKVWIGIFFVIALLAVIDLWDSGPDYPPDASPEQKAKILSMHKIKKLDSYIVDVSEEWMGQRLMIKYQPKSIYDGKRWTQSFFRSAKGVLEKLNEVAPNNAYKQVVFDVQIPTVDKLGNSGHSRGMMVQYNWEEIKSAKWDNLSSWDIANLPETISFRRLGLESAVEYCSDDDNLKWATKFCGTVAAEL